MRYVLIKSDGSKDAEIAKLKAQLAAVAKASPTPSPIPAARPPRAPDISKANPDNDQLGADAPGDMTGPWLEALLLQAWQAGKLDYAHLKKDPDKYDGRAWWGTGKILEVSDQKVNGLTVEVGRVSLDWYGREPIYFVAPFSSDFVEGNVVDFAGYLTGSQSYTSQAGWNITIPSMAVRAMAKPGTFKKMLRRLE